MDQRAGPSTSALDAAQRSQLERPFKCFECHQVFRRVEHRTRHARSHEVERHLKCSYCNKGFYRLDALKRHEKVHSEPKRNLVKEGARACVTCAMSRRKCSGDSPCSACERRSLTCEYPAAGRSRRRSLGSNGSGAEHMVAMTPESVMARSNVLQSPVAAKQDPDMTYRSMASDQANVVKHTSSHQNRAKNRYTSQTQEDPVFHSPISAGQPQLQSQSSTARNEYPESRQATDLSYLDAFSPTIWLPDAPDFAMDDVDEGAVSFDQPGSHFLDNAPDICELGCDLECGKSGEKRPPCSRCEGRNSKSELGSAQPRRSRSPSSVLIKYDGYEHYRSDDLASQEELVSGNTHLFDGRGLEELETTSGFVSDPEAFENTHLSEDDDVTDIARSPSASIHADGFSTGSRVNAAVAIRPPSSPSLPEFRVAAFVEFSDKRSRRALVDHFCNVFSHLVVFGEDLENPFQQLILPLARKGSPVMNAIYALSSAHLENRGVVTEEKSLYFHNQATMGLARAINHIEISNEEDVLSTILLLVYYESLVQRDSSNMVISHLKGAITVINSFSQSSSPTSMFIQRAFRYYDVITALSFSTTPISTTSAPLLPLSISGNRCLSPSNDVDSLLGMSTKFWHIIHRLSILYELKGEMQKAEARGDTTKVTVLRTELDCTSQAIEHALTQWKPSTIKTFSSPRPTTASSSQPPLSPSLGSANGDYDISFCDTTDGLTNSEAHILSIASNAEAYRQAALVFLYRNIHMLERSHPKVQMHGHLTLAACLRVVRCTGPIPALLWPLFISSVEAVSEEDRGIATMAFVGAEKRQGMLNITRAWDIVQEVWRRGDEGEAADWRSVCEEMGVSLVFG